MRARTVFISTLVLLFIGAPAVDGQEGPTLPSFETEAELRAFLDELAVQRQEAILAAQECGDGGPSLVSRTADAADPGDAVVIRGAIRSVEAGALEGAQVSIASTTIGTLTGQAGAYRLRVPADAVEGVDTLRLRAQLIGYAAQSLDVPVSPGDSIVADFVLCTQAMMMEQMVVAGAAAPAAPVATGESVTNVQHAGVDEGGIVKVHGDHLVILRRGRLFTVEIGDSVLRPVSAVDAFPRGMEPGRTWYDELLVAGDRVVVIGFSYGRRATEIGLFRIDDDGRLRHRNTYHLRSNDYYSSRNYSSRLIGSRLILYSPLWIFPGRGDLAEWMPAMRRWRPEADRRDAGFEPVITASRVYRPGRPLRLRGYPVMHTVTMCDLSGLAMECEATAVLGPSGRVFYVSLSAVYVWVSGWPVHDEEHRRADAMLYRIPVDGGAPAALGVRGSPVDQLSFLESDDGHLNVLTRGGAWGEGMWRAERGRGEPALLRVPLDAFSDGSRDAPRSAYRAVPDPGDGTFHNRFVGRHVLYGTGAGWWSRRGVDTGTVHVVRWTDGATAALSLPHGVDRIEAMGSDAVVIGADSLDLHFTGIDLDALPSVAQHYVRHGAVQGEQRTHAFFYRSDGPESGTIGLPVRGQSRPGYEHLFEESASILFLRNRDAAFRELGELTARPADAADGCVVSCVDWYGNSRPLFLRGRIFALLGYELVEGELRDGRMREVRRVSFSPGSTGRTEP